MARGARKRPGAGAKDAPRPAPLPGRGRFYACYLLVSLSEKRKGGKGRTYIGFTVNPKRRIRQHNGELAMGACSTRALRPWQMVLVVYGFSSKARALAFEWAWQHPRRSRSIKDKVLTMTRGSLVGVKGKARILRELLASETFAQEVPRLRVQLLDSKYAEVLPILADTNVSVSVAPLAEVPMEEYETASSRSDASELDEAGGFGEDEWDAVGEATSARRVDPGPGICYLCYGGLIDGCAAMACRCRSTFHINCLERHLGEESGCPLCEYPLTLDEAAQLGREQLVGTKEGDGSILPLRRRLVERLAARGGCPPSPESPAPRPTSPPPVIVLSP